MEGGTGLATRDYPIAAVHEQNTSTYCNVQCVCACVNSVCLCAHVCVCMVINTYEGKIKLIQGKGNASRKGLRTQPYTFQATVLTPVHAMQ